MLQGKCNKREYALKFISYFVKKWYGHGYTSHTNCCGSEILTNFEINRFDVYKFQHYSIKMHIQM